MCNFHQDAPEHPNLGHIVHSDAKVYFRTLWRTQIVPKMIQRVITEP